MDLQKVLVDVKIIALKAGEYILERMDDISKLEYKNNNFTNLVTDVDKGTEKLIVNYLRSKYPDFSVLSEEGTNYAGDNSYKWIIDPIDGTTNFVHGFPFFCVSIGLEYNDEIVLGVVYDPSHDEMFSAVNGQGSFLNDKQIKVSKNELLKAAILATGFANTNNFDYDKKIMDIFWEMTKRTQSIRRTGSAALHLCYVACGRLDGYWETGLSPWDTAAGILIVKEAGGKITNFKSDKFSCYEKEILASNGLIHEEMKRTMINLIK